MKNLEKISSLMGVFSGIFLLVFLTVSCDIIGLEEEDESATMCFARSGGYLQFNCKTNSNGTCEEDGKSSLGNYENWGTCMDDISEVVGYYEDTGEIRPGPNSIGGGGGNDGGGGSSVNCDIANYDGPEFDIQVDSQCKAAYIYDCVGDTVGRDAACALYYEYGNAVWTGSGSLPVCKYCN